jgi:hypothetical protein
VVSQNEHGVHAVTRLGTTALPNTTQSETDAEYVPVALVTEHDTLRVDVPPQRPVHCDHAETVKEYVTQGCELHVWFVTNEVGTVIPAQSTEGRVDNVPSDTRSHNKPRVEKPPPHGLLHWPQRGSANQRYACGQANVLHGWEIVAFALVMPHSTGETVVFVPDMTHIAVRVCVPPPHDTEHADGEEYASVGVLHGPASQTTLLSGMDKPASVHCDMDTEAPVPSKHRTVRVETPMPHDTLQGDRSEA